MMNDAAKEQNGKNSTTNNLTVKRELQFGKFYIQSHLVISLPKYLISFFKQNKSIHTTSNLKSLKRHKLGESFQGRVPLRE